MIGTTIGGRYEILRQLGQGGMGAVYEARHTGTGRRVAVKLISADIGKNPSLLARFELEARAAGGLESQHVAQVLDVGRDDATSAPFMVMEYLAGEDVHQLVKRLGPLRIDLALRIAAQACLGLQRAHEAHIIHRDIKSANLFLARRDGGERVVKILDFGIAKVKMDEMQKTEGGITQTGAILGSPLFMSPEQARGKKTIDHRSDLWSLGVVLYQMLAGKTPNHGIESLGELIIQICSEPAPRVTEAAPWVAPEIASIVAKALDLQPANRYQSAEEMFRDLKALIGPSIVIEEPMVAALAAEERISAVAQVLTSPAAQITTPARASGSASPVLGKSGTSQVSTGNTTGAGAVSHDTPAPLPRSPRWPLWAAGTAVVATASGLTFWLTRSSPAPSDPGPATTIRLETTSVPTAAPTPSITPAASPEIPASPPTADPSPSASASAKSPAAKGTSKPAASAAKTASPTAAASTPPPSATVSGRIIRTTLP